MMFMMELFIRGQKRPRDQYGLVATSDPDDVTCEHLKIRRQRNTTTRQMNIIWLPTVQMTIYIRGRASRQHNTPSGAPPPAQKRKTRSWSDASENLDLSGNTS